jgi:hypothetical protein
MPRDKGVRDSIAEYVQTLCRGRVEWRVKLNSLMQNLYPTASAQKSIAAA